MRGPAQIVFCALALVPALAVGPALADGLRCADLGKAPGPSTTGLCAALAAAPRLGSHAHAERAVGVWRRVYGPMAALTGRDAALTLLGPDARLPGGRELPPTAVVCPGAPPAVYVPWSLLERVYGPEAGYPEDFLAFVLGHELGHRVNDITDDGCELAAFQRPGQGRADEALADHRGAFFAAAGGFSARAVARDDLVTAFLDVEFKVRGHAAEVRKAALSKALERFDAYEHLYQTALAFAFGASRDTALRLLAWADELVSAHGVPLPELTLVRGLVALMAAAPDAPVWAGLDARLATLRCEPVFPAHSAFWDGPRKVRRAAGRGEQLLAEARRHLERAQDLGANDAVVHSGLGCVALYRGDAAEARRRFTRASTWLTAPAPREALDKNTALLSFLEEVRRSPPPGPADLAGRAAWARRLAAAAPELTARPELGAALAVLQRPPSSATPPAPQPTCGARAAAPLVLASAGVACPPGMARRHVLPEDSPTPVVTACSDPTGREWQTWVSLPATTEPAYHEERVVLHERRRPDGAAASLEAWRCACGLEPRGAADSGGRVSLARCQEPMASALMFSSAQQVERVLVFHAAE